MSEQKRFYQHFNPVSGQMEWKTVAPGMEADDEAFENDEDMVIQIARSNFGDMIYDYDRNDRYSAGLKSEIEKLKVEGKAVHVVDIGTGTGLLSLMAVRHGADKVTAIEVFDPMAITARKVIERNGCEGKIEVISVRSTEIDENLVKEKADIIVAEVFDTELIGEGALRSFKEGLKTLGKEGCRVVPARGRVWVCPIASEKLQQFRRLPNRHFKAPFGECNGTAAVFDIQFSEIPSNWFEVLAEPFVAFEFNFEDADSIIYKEAFTRHFKVSAKNPALFDTVLMWWDIDMDGSGSNFISTIPPQFSKDAAWRDHWMQAIYYLPRPMEVSPNQEVSLHCSHDEYSLWFNVDSPAEGPSFCSCRIHNILSRYDFYRLHFIDENDAWINWIQEACKNKVVVTLGQGSLISLYASKTAKSVYNYSECRDTSKLVAAYAKLNDLSNLHIVEQFNDLQNEINSHEILILAEPFFSTSILPWHGLIRFSTLLQNLKRELNYHENIKVLPKNSKLVCLPVKFEHLWKIAAPVGTVDGFDLSDFDVICQKARQIADPIVEQHSLFEYPSLTTGEKQEVFTLDMDSKTSPKTTVITPTAAGTNALVFWTETEFSLPGEGGDNVVKLSNGLLSDSTVGTKPEWHPGHRQGVYFLPFEKLDTVKAVEICVKHGEEDLDFNFKIL